MHHSFLRGTWIHRSSLPLEVPGSRIWIICVIGNLSNGVSISYQMAELIERCYHSLYPAVCLNTVGRDTEQLRC